MFKIQYKIIGQTLNRKCPTEYNLNAQSQIFTKHITFQSKVNPYGDRSCEKTM